MTLRGNSEQASRTYPSWVYSLSFCIIELPYTCMATIPFTLIMYFMVCSSAPACTTPSSALASWWTNRWLCSWESDDSWVCRELSTVSLDALHRQVGFRSDAETFFQFLLTNCAYSIAMNSFGYLLVAVSPNVAVGQVFGGLLTTLFNLFAGFFIVRVSTFPWLCSRVALGSRHDVGCDALPFPAGKVLLALPNASVCSSCVVYGQPFASIPRGWIWFYWANPMAHALRALLMPQVCANCETLRCRGTRWPVPTHAPDGLCLCRGATPQGAWRAA